MRDKTPRHCTFDNTCEHCGPLGCDDPMFCGCDNCENCCCDDCLDAVAQRCEDFAPRREFIDRERTVHLAFTDINGSSVRVMTSHAAMRHCVRLFIDYDREVLTSGHPGLGLCRGMMAELRDTLNRVLTENPVESGALACEHRITPYRQEASQ